MTPTNRNHADTTDLGTALLIAEFENTGYEPISAVSTLREAREFAANDLSRRMKQLEAGEEPECPIAYKVWTRRADGGYAVASEVAGLVD